MQLYLRTALVALVLVTAGGCDREEPLAPVDRPVLRVEVSPGDTLIAIGRVVQFEATAFDAVGHVNRSITWSTSDEQLATVDSAGLVTTTGVGIVRVRATSDGVTGEAELRIVTWDVVFTTISGIQGLAQVVRLTGGAPAPLFTDGRSALDAAVSHDGTRIAYAVRDVEGYTDLWVANRDGSGARLLVATDGNDQRPSWSPDGTRIAFQSDAAGMDDIYIVNMDGTGLRRLTVDAPGIGVADVHPAWAPDGGRIAYASNRNGMYDIFTIRPDGSGDTRITDSQGSDLEPAWSPGGARLAFRRVTADNEWDIWIVNNNGSGAERIALPGQQQAPAWHPEGVTIAFTSRAGITEPWQLWTMAFTGHERVMRAAPAGGAYRPGWVVR